MRDAVVAAAAATSSCMRMHRPRMIYIVVSLEKSLIILGDGETPVDKICHRSNIMAKCY